MKKLVLLLCVLAVGIPGLAAGKNAPPAKKTVRILFLHHSTGQCIWQGGVKAWFDAYNMKNGTDYRITDRIFPKDKPYGWANYPYDYWNIWVNHAGNLPYLEEPTLETLTKQYDVIVFKHCFPVSGIQPDTGKADLASSRKSLENYKLQYAALKKKLLSFPKTKFIVWTPTALVKANSNEAEAKRASEFSEWVKTAWDTKGDNIFLWDFRALETGDGLFLKPEYAKAKDNSHPNDEFSKKAAPLFCRRAVDVIEGRGDK